MIKKIVKRDGRIVAFNQEKITFAILQAAIEVGGRDRKTAENITNDVIKLLQEREYKGSYQTVEEVQDLVERCLIKRGHAKTAKAYILYRYEHALKRAGKQSLTYSSGNIPYKKLWQALSWAVDHNCVNTDQLTEIIDNGKFPQFIELAEDFYRNEIDQVIEKIKQKLDELKIIIVAGPSSSGKTTTSKKLAIRLKKLGYNLATLNIDNYFFDLDLHPRDSHGDYDFETPQSIDLKLINQHLHELLAGKTVKIPFYNFKKGKRDGFAQTLCLKTKSIILIDSLHGMFAAMTKGIAEHKKFRIYIETLAQLKDRNHNYIRWSDIRLLRRMVRDSQFRNYDALNTITHWHHVRRSELRYIISNIKNAHIIINSYLAYELPVIKNRLQHLFPLFIKHLKKQSDKEDAYERTLRIEKLFTQIPLWQNEKIIPLDSLLREFIGGSNYSY
jgi:uridine kinase